MASSAKRPGVTGILTIFYYRDLAAAADWYEHRLGFERACDFEGQILFRVHQENHLALVADGHGSQRPIVGRNKGAVLSIQTDDLEGWREHFAGRGFPLAKRDIVIGYGGRTREFKLYDPEGYAIEFFEWIDLPADLMRRQPGI